MKKVMRLLAYVVGLISQDLLEENALQAAEIRVLLGKVKGRLTFTDEERRTLATLAHGMSRKLLSQVETIVTPDTLLRWYREMEAKKFDGSKKRGTPGRPPTEAEIQDLVLKFARENPRWGYRRIVGALANIGHEISHQTVADILQRNGVPPAPERKRGMSWAEFIRTHIAVLAATDFFTVNVLTPHGLVTYYVLFFMRLATRTVEIAGITTSPDEEWMKQVARNVTMAGEGFLNGMKYLIHDRDTKFCEAFRTILDGADIECLQLPPHSPNLNAFAERWVRTVKEECISRMIFFGEATLRYALDEFVAHFHAERNHQGRNNAILAPREVDRIGQAVGRVRCRERLGGLLKFYHRVGA